MKNILLVTTFILLTTGVSKAWNGRLEETSATCGARPTGFFVNSISAEIGNSNTVASFNWDRGLGTDYELRYRPAAGGTWTTIYVADQPSSVIRVTVGSLSTGTKYQALVRSVCPGSPATYSIYTLPVTFFTSTDINFLGDDVNALLGIDLMNDANNTLNWNTESNYYNWDGVTWSEEIPHRVTGLSIENKALTGSFDVTKLTQLVTFTCDNNQLTSISASSLGFLDSLNCAQNQLTNLNVTNSSNLRILSCDNNLLSAIDLTGLNNLAFFSCSSNALTTLDVTQCITLKTVHAGWNKLTSLNVAGLANLETLTCYRNNLAVLDLNGLSKLFFFDGQSNQITKINGQGTLKGLDSFYCSDNKLTELDFSQIQSVGELRCENNLITSLILPTVIYSLNCSNNKLGALDLFRQSYYLASINCSYNNLFSVNISPDLRLRATWCDHNNLPFSELLKLRPEPSLPSVAFVYAPQNEVFYGVASVWDVDLDYSSQAIVGGSRTIFRFYKDNVIVASNTNGKFRTTGLGSYYCTMVNFAFRPLILKTAQTQITSAMVTPGLANVTAAAQNVMLTFETTTPFSVSSDQPWATLGSIIGTTVNILVTANTGSQRTAIITFSALDGTYSITAWIVQESNVMASAAREMVGEKTEDVETTHQLTSYPNPVTNTIFVEVDPSKKTQLSLHTLYGSQLLSKEYVSTSVGELDVNHLPSGQYILRIATQDKVLNERVVIVK